MNATQTLIENNARFAARVGRRALPGKPAKHVAVIACMDARLDIAQMLGLDDGEAHVIRNAGGIVTDDVLRSLIISQRLLGTREVIVIHHTDCGMERVHDAELRAQIARDTGTPVPFAMQPYPSEGLDLHADLNRLRECAFLIERAWIRGFMFDVESGRLEELETSEGPR